MRTHYCGQVNEALIGQVVTVAGWVHRRRDHGGVIFVDLRDREGLLQIVFDPDRAAVFAQAERVRNEFVLKVTGMVRARPPGTANANLKSGQVELLCQELDDSQPLRAAAVPARRARAARKCGCKYRYLDLRREEMRERLLLRHRITRAMRSYLDDDGFVDIETPMLTKATPEGARDYLVPSRTHAGKFFALPQSPQIFKQLLMIAGFDRYYQIVRCFRDEDLRADRQPEFTQLDIETSFLDQDEIQALMEGLVRALVQAGARRRSAESVAAHDLCRGDAPLRLRQARPAHPAGAGRCRRSGARTATSRCSQVRPPIRWPRHGAAACRRAARCRARRSTTTRRIVARYGAKGLAYVKVNDIAKGRDGLQSPILKFLSDAAISGILRAHRAPRRRFDFLRRRHAPRW